MLAFKQGDTIRIAGEPHIVESLDNEKNRAHLKDVLGKIKHVQFHPEAEYPHNGMVDFIC